MKGANIMSRLFNLYLIYLKSDNAKDKMTLKNEIDLLEHELMKDDTVPSEIKRSFEKLLKEYNIIYGSNDLIKKTEAEERAQELLDEMKAFVGYPS